MNGILFFVYNVMITTPWDDITRKIGELFMGNASHNITGIFGPMGGSAVGETVLGTIILMFFLFLTAVYGMGILIGSAVLIPALFIVFNYIPPLRIVVGLFIGIIFGIGLHRYAKR